MRRRLRAIRANEAGTTLIEISVTMLLLGIVITMFLAFVSSMQNATARQEARVERNDEVRLALAQLDREIRSGNVLYDPSTETNASGDVVPNMALRIYTQADAPNRNPGNQCSQWRITNGVIQTRRWSMSDPSGSVTPWWTVAHNIVNRTVSPQVPAFTLDKSSASYGNRLMKIRLVVDRPDDQAGAQEVDLSLTGRNTQYYKDQDPICSVVPSY